METNLWKAALNCLAHIDQLRNFPILPQHHTSFQTGYVFLHFRFLAIFLEKQDWHNCWCLQNNGLQGWTSDKGEEEKPTYEDISHRALGFLKKLLLHGLSHGRLFQLPRKLKRINFHQLKSRSSHKTITWKCTLVGQCYIYLLNLGPPSNFLRRPSGLPWQLIVSHLQKRTGHRTGIIPKPVSLPLAADLFREGDGAQDVGHDETHVWGRFKQCEHLP